MKKSPLAINLEYYAVRFFCGLINVLPYAAALSFARGIGWLMFNVLRFKRARTLSRIRGVFPEKPLRECRAIALESLQGFLQMGIEMLRAPTFDVAWMDRHVKDGRHYKDVLQALLNEGHGVVIMVPHCGNYFMPGWAMVKYGLPLFAIGSRQRNPKLNDWLYHNQYGDLEVLERNRKDTLVRIHEKIREGRAFAIMPDLRVQRRDVEVDFLNGKANVSRAGAMFAVHCRCPIAVAMMRRENGRHVFDYLATLRPDPNASDKKEEARRLTRETLKLLSDEIRKNPGDWYWFNKRWILEPV